MSIWIMFLLLLLFLAIGVPIAFGLGLASLFYLMANGMPISMVPQKMTISLENFIFIALPLFILAGEIMNTGGLTQKLVNVARAIVGRFRGGLAYVNVLVSMLFGGVQGLATADTVAIGSVLIPAMEKAGYRKDFSAGVTVASSTISSIIPPGMLFIIFGSVTGVSIGSLFLGGMVPGILLGLAQMALVFFYAHNKKLSVNIPAGERLSLHECLRFIVQGLPTLLLPVIIIGGIVTGIATATESAVLAVVYALFLSLVTHEIRWSDLPGIFFKSAKMVGSVMVILCTSSIFGYILTQERVPQMVVELLFGITNNKFVLLLIINLFLLFVGTFMDSTPSCIILAPILLPILVEMNMDPVHIGVFMCFNLAQGLITPPVGSCLYLASGISQLPVEKIAKAMMPFFLINVVVLLLITYFPPFVLFVPSLAG
ncbi:MULTISPECIES: TRAP transporter large permease [Anaerotruncus]|jgi:C4-dicarboxylate transporter DctM subunit|uniref:TRAP transporter large permease n=1 Tax=Anaerotruncus TaxID=244127 RepID=UPI000E5398B3|nr:MULTISPECIES: TRAP transporter large permease [Anaerotruncus]RGX54747.1 TRAP transporter large permease [Anaerotruncus sp. AF02-27]